MNYPVGDFLIRLKNASRSNKRTVEVVKTKLIKAVAEALKKAGYLDEIGEKAGKLVVDISYRKKKPLFLSIRLVSKPGMRVYMGVDELEKIKKPSVFIISTSKGVMFSAEALKKGVGGEVIAEIL